MQCMATAVHRHSRDTACCVALQVLHDQIVQFTDAGAATGTAVVTFDTMSLLAPRGRFEVEMYLSSLKLTGQVSPFMASESCNHVVH